MTLSDIIRVFHTRAFGRWMRKSGLDGGALRLAVKEMEAGLVDADLGGGLLKKRIALPGQGKRGGARTLVAIGRARHWFFLYGFSKNERSDLDPDELGLVRAHADALLMLTPMELAHYLDLGAIKEVDHDD